MSISRNLPGGIELPGPIALTDSNSSRRSGSGRLGETLTSIWGNTAPSAGPSANSSVLPSPLEGPSSRSALLNALKPLASVPEGSAIPEVVHADETGAGAVPQVYRSSPPKTPKAETPHASASPSRVHTSTSAAATSPKPTGTPRAASRAPTAAASPRSGGTPRGQSIYSNATQPPPAAATPSGLAMGTAFPVHFPPSTEAPTEQPTMLTGPEVVPPAISTPKPASRVPTKPSTRVSSPKPPLQSIEPPVAEPPMVGVESVPVAPEPIEPPSDPLATEPVQAESATAEEEDMFGWGQPKSKAASRKGSKGTSKAGSKATSKVPSKATTPKGIQTPKQVDLTSEGASAGMSAESPAAGWPKPPSGGQSPLATVPEDPPTEVNPEDFSAPPGGFFVVNPDETHDAPPAPAPALPEPPAQAEANTLSTFGGSLGGGVGGSLFGAATSALGWGGFGKKDGKSKPSTPGTSTPAWGLGSVAPSVAESTGGGSGWGAATGNDGRSNPPWMSFGGGNKSGNVSTTDLLGGAGTTDPSMQVPAEGGELYSQPPVDGMLGEGAQEELFQGDLQTQEPLTLQTDLTATAEAETAGPTTAAGNSPEVEGREGAGGDGIEEDAAEKPEDEEWGFPVKTKKKKGNASAGAATPVTPSGAAGGGDDAWATSGPGGKKKKGKKK
ncbi:hypothetical protein BC826DRAFT_629413 [Russula brevipes]|nr:hypothetical protein BC826DRAFT_629413 [Russula brevipes]